MLSIMNNKPLFLKPYKHSSHDLAHGADSRSELVVSKPQIELYAVVSFRAATSRLV